ncbi:hypothetical protein JT05_12520 [Desulfosporosinus sp. Tol-M]|nr:hypothetical protein JT05_12520 [Desulfosporosinus sp. Tol-M]
MKCILQYFVAKAQDPEIKAMMNDALNIILPQQSTITTLFNSVGFPVPHGFTDEDVKINAKRLYSDSLMLSFHRAIIRFRLVQLAHALPLATRPDVRDFFNDALVQEQNLLNKAEDLLTKKGINVRPPYTPVPDRVKYIADNSWYGNLFGSERPINILELTQVFKRLENKLVENAIQLGFTQVVKDPKIKAYFSRGLNIFDKEIEKWSKVLNKEDMILPMSWKSEVTDSSESPFSDKLMLFRTVLNIAYSVYANGFALANCNRTDLVTAFAKVELNLSSYGKDGLDLMIANGWMEEIPLAVDRKGLKH